MREPSCKEYDGKELCIAGNQYTWIQYFIDEKNFAITAMLDDQKELVQYYIDVAKDYEIDERGLPYFDDLYLDVVLLPNGKIYVLDEDELEDAYKSGDVTKEEYELAVHYKVDYSCNKNNEFYWISILEEEIKKLK